MEVNGTRNCLVTDTELFNSGGVEKWAYFQKKVEYPFKEATELYFFLIGKASQVDLKMGAQSAQILYIYQGINGIAVS